MRFYDLKNNPIQSIGTNELGHNHLQITINDRLIEGIYHDQGSCTHRTYPNEVFELVPEVPE
jgi:hypothetical protein